jgi:murein DD-endopeptidase MepM/ murein hydrolase activator NlpD
MGDDCSAGCGWHAAAASVLLAGLLAGCGPAAGPAPVVSALPQPMTITIVRGQTLSGIAYAYHVPMRELAALNHLYPPYRILAGGVLVIPATGAARPPETLRAEAAPITSGAAPVAAATAPVRVAALPAQSPATYTRPPSRPSEAAAPASLASQRPTELARTEQSAEPRPEEQGPPAKHSTESGPGAPAPTTASPRSMPEKLAAVATIAPPVHHGDIFLWPVRGRLIEGFGPEPNGTHNDGINIAAPRGSPVQAVDAGVVAYAGNELRGYGNLILIKHPGDWISAYAHCDLILVKRGQKVVRGQVIARVGATGNVKTPQLHFELRRGDKPVDPRAYLPVPPGGAVVPARSG